MRSITHRFCDGPRRPLYLDLFFWALSFLAIALAQM
jgi:hypothetical protein